MKETFVTKSLTAKSLKMVEFINAILAKYEAQGYDLTTRQVYYQLVSRDVIENTPRSYKNTAALISNARLAGLIDWNMIVDRGRVTHSNTHWESPSQIIQHAALGFRIDKWSNQPNYVEVMCEKQALEGILIPVCSRLDVRFSANKGYSSSSALYGVGKRLARLAEKGKQVWVLYLGDHDPSGIDMTRDIAERLNMFSGVGVNVRRLALQMRQIQSLRPPPNPAKENDARFKGYVEKYGDTCWELDAIEPGMLADIVTKAVVRLRDDYLWAKAIDREDEMRMQLDKAAIVAGKFF